MNSIYQYFRNLSLVMLLSLLPAPGAFAAEVSIAILDFELNDLTLDLNPANPEEVERTASIKPLLQKALKEKGGYKIVDIDVKTQETADAGFGYLYDHHDVAAELGQSVGADWVVVGRNHKPSFLFVYFNAQLINTKTKQLAGTYSVEVKGQQKKLTPKGVERLVEQINETIHLPAANSSR